MVKHNDGPNVETHSGTVHATRGTQYAFGKQFPRPRCGAGRSTSIMLAETTRPVTCTRCLARIAKDER